MAVVKVPYLRLYLGLTGDVKPTDINVEFGDTYQATDTPYGCWVYTASGWVAYPKSVYSVVSIGELSAGANKIGSVNVRNNADDANIDPLAEATFTGRMGEVQDSPTAYTALARLKELKTGIVLAAGSNNIGDVDIASFPALSSTTDSIATVGTIADDATTPGKPVVIGGVAVETDGTDPTSVSAEADVAHLRTTRDRRLLVSDVSPRLGSALQEETSAQTNHEVAAAPGASLSLYITDIVVSNGATAGSIKFVEDTGGTPVTKIGTLYLAINGGAVMNFKTPIRITANKNFGFTSTTMTTHTVTVNYYVAP